MKIEKISLYDFFPKFKANSKFSRTESSIDLIVDRNGRRKNKFFGK